jgi:hypothetical protein
MIRRILVVAVLVGSFTVVSLRVLPSSATGVIVDEGFIPVGTQGGAIGRQGVRMMERPDYAETASVLRGKQPGGGWKSCSSLSDPNCAGGVTVTFSAILQPCVATTDLNCVAEFGVVAPDGAKIPASVTRKFPSEALNKYPGDAAAGLPPGEPGALWTVPASAGLANSLHYVRASVQGTITSNGKASFTDFAASLTPVSMVSMNCEQTQGWLRGGANPCTSGDMQTTRDQPGFSGFVEGSGWSQNLDCEMSGNADYVTETAECALRKPAALSTAYYLGVRLAQSPQGWLHGRLADADVDIDPVAGAEGAVTLAIVGKAVRVPMVFKEVPFGDLPTNLQEKYRATGGWPSTVGLGGASSWGAMDSDSNSPTGRNRLSIPPSYGPDGIAELEAWMPFLNDTSTADRVTWSLRTLRTWERSQASSCLSDRTRVTGLVTTNATQYLAGAPTYNADTSSLDYKVAAPHYMSNGEEFKGSYQMIVRSDVARCIYKFGAGALSASVEVLEPGQGEAKIQIANASESDGWLRLSASGYTHSTPVIRAKFKEATLPVKVRGAVRGADLAKFAGLTIAKSARITLTVGMKSRKFCQVVGSTIKGIRRGHCPVSMTVYSAGKRSKATVTVRIV